MCLATPRWFTGMLLKLKQTVGYLQSMTDMVGHSFQNSKGYTGVFLPRVLVYIRYVTTIWIAYIRIIKWPHNCVNSSAGICEINAQIYASYKDEC